MSRICPICQKGELIPSKVRVALAETPVGVFDGYRCNTCAEEFLAETSLEPAHSEIVKSGLFGITKVEPIPTPTLTIFQTRLVVSGSFGGGPPNEVVRPPIFRSPR